MFAHRTEFFKGLVTLVCVLALIAFAGCGGDESATDPQAASAGDSSRSETGGEGTDPADADPADLEVIEDWSRTLSSGDVEGAAAYFAVPSIAENGLGIQIESRADAVTFNEALPCGAEVVSAETDDDVTTATFRLSERPGGDCGGGTGGEAMTAFRIEDGEIVEWRRVDPVPTDPGGGGGAGAAGAGDPV